MGGEWAAKLLPFDKVLESFKLRKNLSSFSVSEESNSLSAAEKMFRLYDEVETFVLFIGYPRSQHSLIGAILDAHPEIIIPHEYGPFTNWNKFQSQRVSRKNLQKYMLFNELQQASEKQALFGIRANRNNTLLGQLEYTYNVPGLWQGGYDKKIKVNKCLSPDVFVLFCFVLFCLRQLQPTL